MKQTVVFILVVFMTSAFACDAITRNGIRCKRASVPGSNYCWQHGGGRAPSSHLSSGVTIHPSDTFRTNGNIVVDVPKTPRHKLVVKTFLGVPIGGLARQISGTTIKGKANSKLVSIRSFRKFSKATVTFTRDGERVCCINSEYIFPPKATKEAAYKEADAILKIIEAKSGIKFRKIGGYNLNGSSALGRIGANFGGGTLDWDYEYYESGFVHIRLTCRHTKVENKTLHGPNTQRELDAWKIVLSFRVLNTDETNWHEFFSEGIALP